MRLIVKVEAILDLDEVYEYGLINFGLKISNEYLNKIQSVFYLLIENPFIGRLDTRVQPPIRRFETQNHVIFYDINEEFLIIIRILHKSVDFLNVF